MRYKKFIENIFDFGFFSITWKLMIIFNCWVSGFIDIDDTQALCLEVGFTFTKPTTTGQTIFVNNMVSSTTYTLMSLITDYYNNDYSKSGANYKEIFRFIDILQSKGYLLTSEQSFLEGADFNW